MIISGQTEPTPFPAVSSIDIGAGEAPSENLETLDGTTTETGSVPPGSITLDVLWNPGLLLMQDAHDAYVGSLTRQFRLDTPSGGVIFSENATANIAWTAENAAGTGGVVTLTGTDGADFSGTVFKVGDLVTVDPTGTPIRAIIVFINDDGTVVRVAAPPAQPGQTRSNLSAQTADSYQISRPSYRIGPFAGTISAFGAVSVAAGGRFTSTISVQPNSILQKPYPVY